jgi:hypothetical protein
MLQQNIQDASIMYMDIFENQNYLDMSMNKSNQQSTLEVELVKKTLIKVTIIGATIRTFSSKTKPKDFKVHNVFLEHEDQTSRSKIK